MASAPSAASFSLSFDGEMPAPRCDEGGNGARTDDGRNGNRSVRGLGVRLLFSNGAVASVSRGGDIDADDEDGRGEEEADADELRWLVSELV